MELNKNNPSGSRVGVSEMHLLPKFATITKNLSAVETVPLCTTIQFIINLGWDAVVPPQEQAEKEPSPVWVLFVDDDGGDGVVAAYSPESNSICRLFCSNNTISCCGTLFFFYVQNQSSRNSIPKFPFAQLTYSPNSHQQCTKDLAPNYPFVRNQEPTKKNSMIGVRGENFLRHRRRTAAPSEYHVIE